MALSTQWRVYITDNHGSASYTGLAELEMADAVAGANLCTGGTPISSSSHGSYGEERAFNGLHTNPGDYGWITSGSGATRLPSWIGYQFATAVQIREFRIWSNEDGLTGGNDDPRDFVLQYYDDQLADWVSTDASYTNEPAWTNYEQRTYVGDITTPTKYYVSGKTTRGNNVPCQRNLFFYDQLNGGLVGTGTSDPITGDFTIEVDTPNAVYARAVDSEGLYNSVIRENLIPDVVLAV